MTSLGDDNLTKILHVEKILGYLNNRRVDEVQIDKINDGIFLGDSNINLNSTEYNNRFQVGLSNNNFIIRDLVNEEDRITIDKNTGEITFNPSLPTTNLSNLNDVDISNLSNGNLLFFRETANQFQFTNSIKIKDDDDIEVKDDMFFVNGADVNIDTTTSNYYVGEELDRLRFIRYDSTDDVVQIGRDAATGCNQTGTIGNVYIGLNAGKFNQQNNNIGIGRDALEFCDCNSVIGIGRQACEGQDVEDQSIGIGRATNQNVSKYGSISIGRFAGYYIKCTT
jgi:hypothetical protein